MPDTATDLLAEKSGSTLHLTLNRPDKMNALSAGLVDRLLHAVQTAHEDGTRLLVLRGAGRNFSAGFDMADVAQHSEGDLLLRFVRIEQLLQAVYYAPFDTLALAHGRNFGAGADLVCSCARRIGAPDASFRMPGLGFGLVLGTRRLAARIGAEPARRVLATGHVFAAEESLSLGFLHSLANPDNWGAQIRQAETAAQALAPSASRMLFDLTRQDTREADMSALVLSAAAPGIQDRIAAYLAASRPRTAETPR